MSFTIEKPLAWLSDPDLKEEVLLRMKQHRAEDSIIQGKYQVYAPELATKYKGCLLGCTLPMQPYVVPGGRPSWEIDHDYFSWHMEVEKSYGIPYTVAHLMESVFEALPFGKAAQFAVDSIEAIPVGADLSGVMDRWKSFLNSHPSGIWGASARMRELLTILREAPVPEPAQ